MDDTPSVELQKLDLDQRRLRQERRLKLTELKVQKQLKLKELEVQKDLKLKELEVQKRQLAKGQWSGPFAAAVLAGTLALVGQFVGSRESRDLEDFKQKQSLKLEGQKQEGTLILEAIKTAGSATEKDKLTAKNLVFLADADLIKSIPPARLQKLRDLAGSDPVPSLPATAPVSVANPGDNFIGLERATAKLSLSDARLETFDDLHALIASLTPDAVMTTHRPPISLDAESGRVAEENRRVRVHAFLYAFSREADNDFHLIVGRAPNLTPAEFMTVEISGLPSPAAPSYPSLKAARDSFAAEFAGNLLNPGYNFIEPPMPVDVEGSLFFDLSHAAGPRPGPTKAKPKTVWEVHPVSKITFPASEGPD